VLCAKFPTKLGVKYFENSLYLLED